MTRLGHLFLLPRSVCPDGWRCPRADRRGLAALSGAVLASAVLLTMLATWQLGQARVRLEGMARHLATTVEAEGYALHHWLHAAQGSLTPPPAAGTARTLSEAETTELFPYAAPWRRDGGRMVSLRGWEIVPLAGAGGRGVIVLRPSRDVTGSPIWKGLQAALDVRLGGSDATDEARMALASTTDPFDPDEDRAFFASNFARLESDALLRQAHAGQSAQAMAAALDMGGHKITGAGVLTVGQSADIRTVTGPVSLTGSLSANRLNARDASDLESMAASGQMTVRTDVTGLTSLRTEEMRISGETRIENADDPVRLSACADAEADLCGGGDLDVTGASGVPDWSMVTIFGDVSIRDGNDLTDVAEATVGSAIFEEVTGDLDVTGCLRVSSPFLYGENC